MVVGAANGHLQFLRSEQSQPNVSEDPGAGLWRMGSVGFATPQHRPAPATDVPRFYSPQHQRTRIPEKVCPSPRKASSSKHRRSWTPDDVPQASAYPTAFGLRLRDAAAVPLPPALLRLALGGSQGPAVPRGPPKLRVGLRVGGASNPSCLSVDGRRRQLSLTEPAASARTANAALPRLFSFDAVFGPDEGLAELCGSSLGEPLGAVLSGAGDAALLCLGNPGAAKSRSSLGDARELGLFPTAIGWLFRLISEWRAREPERRFSVRVSAVEVGGADEALRDLLAPLSDASPGLSLAADPVAGLRLTGAAELRVASAEQAASCLDAALAERNDRTADDQRNSHLFFTLHVYQYKLEAQNTSVLGGRSRLHLVEVGSGEKSSRGGRSALTLPAIGNVLLALLQGQKYLPFKDSRLVALLREALGSAASVSVMATVTPEPSRYFDTLNTAQIAARLHRVRRQRKTRLGVGGGAGSSGGESSADERRRLPRATSEPDCVTSSSEQSCDTVIYLGDPRHRKLGGTRLSGGETTEGESSARITPKTPTPPTPRTNPLCGPLHFSGLMGTRPVLPDPPRETWIDGPKAPARDSKDSPTTFREQWIDGPKADYAAVPTPPRLKGGRRPGEELLEPQKRDWIAGWVRGQEAAIRATEPASPPALPQPTSDGESQDSSSPVETRDICIQTEESDIDSALGLRWAPPPDASELRRLEDIAEESEDAASLRSAGSRDLGPHHRNEGLAPSLDPLTLDGLQLLGLSLPSSSEHPLRALSGDVARAAAARGDDSFSCTSEQLDSLSMPCTSELGGSSGAGTDEELEAAMAASVSSLRSTGALERLRSMPSPPTTAAAGTQPSPSKQAATLAAIQLRPLQRRGPLATFAPAPLPPPAAAAFSLPRMVNHCHANVIEETNAPSTLEGSPRAPPDGAEISDHGRMETKPKPKPKPAALACCQSQTSSGSTQGEGKTPPRLIAVTKSPARTARPSSGELCSRLPVAVPKAGWGRSTAATLPAQLKKKAGGAIPVKSSEKPTEAPKAAVPGRSPLLSFLRSPGGGKRAPPLTASVAAGNRASSGYDSGADSGIGAPAVDTSLSPYRQPSRPRLPAQRTSSGHGSDGSSVQSGDAKGSLAACSLVPVTAAVVPVASMTPSVRSPKASTSSRLTAFLTGRGRWSRAPSSSGYESYGTGPRQASESESGDSPSSLRSPPCEGRRSFFSLGRSRSAPQSPAGGPQGRGLRKLRRQVATIQSQQAALKEELRLAKARLGISPSLWSYDLHVLEAMGPGEPGLLEALANETRTLEKRVTAARSHLLITTSFDARPTRPH